WWGLGGWERGRGVGGGWAGRGGLRIRSGGAPWPGDRTDPPPRARSERSRAPAPPRASDASVGGDGRRREGAPKPSLFITTPRAQRRRWMAAQRRQGAPQLPATPLRFATCGVSVPPCRGRPSRPNALPG